MFILGDLNLQHFGRCIYQAVLIVRVHAKIADLRETHLEELCPQVICFGALWHEFSHDFGEMRNQNLFLVEVCFCGCYFK